MSDQPYFPPNPYARGMPGYSGGPSPRRNSPRMGYSGTPRHFNPTPRGFNPMHTPSRHGPPHQHQGGRPHFQHSSYTPESEPRPPYRGGGNERVRGGGYRTPPFGSRGARNNTPHSDRRQSHRSSARIEQYYKHSMVEDPWRDLIAKSQQETGSGTTS